MKKNTRIFVYHDNYISKKEVSLLKGNVIKYLKITTVVLLGE